jgi:hypothetical protein
VRAALTLNLPLVFGELGSDVTRGGFSAFRGAAF